DGLTETPARVARAYAEQFSGLSQRPEDVLTTVFDADHDELILVRDIELYSTCEHHLVPFFGFAHVGYIPNEKGQITGLSKLARLVDIYARRPQVQERMTSQIADALMEVLEPRGALVVIEAEHLCMSMRGVRKPGAKTVTSAVRGIMRDSDRTRAEAMSLLPRGSQAARRRAPDTGAASAGTPGGQPGNALCPSVTTWHGPGNSSRGRGATGQPWGIAIAGDRPRGDRRHYADPP